MRLGERRTPAPRDALERALCIVAATLGVVAFLILVPAASATNVGGAITADTTWTFVGSPYVVTSTVTVSGTSGVDGVTTLTIEPGVEVLFNANTQLVVGGTSSTVKGALDARGSEVSPILLTSNQVTKTRGFWSGVVFQSFANDTLSFLENVTVEYSGSNGVYLNNAEPRIRNATFREASTYGVRIDNANPVLADVILANNTQHGAYVPAAGSPTFQNVTFRGNGQYGLFTSSGIPNVTDATFDANQRPLRMHVESLLTGASFRGHLVNEIDLVATPGALLTKDRTLAPVSDAATSAPLPYVVVESFTVRGTDGADAVTTLTIEPGVELRFNATRAITIAGTTAGQVGALDARGTTEAPILFTSNQASKTRGFWNGVTFNDHANDTLSVLENVTIEFAGSTAALYLNRAEPTIRSCTVRESSTLGVRVDTANTRFEDCEFSNNTQHGASVPSGGNPVFRDGRFLSNGQYGLHVANGIPTLEGNRFALNAQRPLRMHVDSLYADNVLDGNAIQEAELMATPNGIQSLDRTLPRLVDATNGTTIPWIVTASFTVRGTNGEDNVTTLTLEPGAELRFGSGVALDVGTNTAGQVGALVARGTTEAPILFTSNQAAKTRGFWSQLRFYDQANDSVSALENVTIEYGGSGGAQSVYVYRSLPTLRNIVVRESGGQGVYLDDTPASLTDSTIERNAASGVYVRTGSPTIARNVISNNTVNGVYTESGVPAVYDNTFHNNTQRPMRVDYDSRLDGNSFSDDDIAEVELVGGTTIDTDQRFVELAPGYAYVLAAGVRVQGTAGEDGLTTLTIDPGVELRFRSAGQLIIGGSTTANRGALDARGREEAPIVLTSSQAPGTRTAGWWRNVYFDDGAQGNASFIEHVSIEYAGYGYDGALHFDRNSPATLRDVDVRFAYGHGVESYETPASFERVRVEGGGASGAYAMHLSAYSAATLPNVDGFHVADFNGRVLYTAPDAGLRGLSASNVSVRVIDLASQTIQRDAIWPRVVDDAAGEPVAYVMAGTIDMGRVGPDTDNITTLTIEPGVVVRGSVWYSRLVVGNNVPSALVARGTREDPILFTSNAATPAPGDWGRIEIYDLAEDALTLIENVTVEYGGGYYSYGAVYVERALPTFRNNVIRDNELYGLRLYGAPLDIRGSTFERNGGANGYAIYFERGSGSRENARMQLSDVTIANTTGRPARIAPDTLIQNLTLRSNSLNELERIGDYVAYDTTWDTLHDADTGAPVTNLMTGWVTIAARDRPSVATLTIAPGTTIAWDSGGLEIGDPWVLDTAGTTFALGDYAFNQTGVRFLNGTQEGAGCESTLPDVLGYTCAIIPFEFTDINATGAHLTLFDDDVSPLIPIGFNFTFYGRTHDQLYVSSNGFVSFSESWEDGCCSAQALPDPDRPNDLIAGYWEDLDPRLGGGIAYQTLGEAPDRSFIVQFTDIQHYGSGGYNTTFQIVLREGSNAAEVHLLGIESDGGRHVTGVESPGVLVGHGRLVAEGSAALPIILTSSEPEGAKFQGSWSGLDINEASLADSLVANATIEYASGAIYAYQGAIQVRDTILRENRWEAAYLDEAPMRLERVLVEDTGETNSSYGIYVWQGDARLGRAELVDVEIRNTSGTPLAIGADTLLERVSFRNNTREEIEVSYGWGTRDARWAVHTTADTGAELPYILTDYVYIAGADGADGVTTLTLDPGVDVRAQTWGGMVVGDYGGPDTGALDARGTAAEPITFRGEGGYRGQWYAIEFAETSDDERSFLENVTIEHGGRGRYGALYLYNASPTIRDVVVRTSDTIGIYLDGAAATLERTTVEDTTGTFAYAIYADPASRGASLRDVTIRTTGGKPLAMAADSWLEGVELVANARNEVDVWPGEIAHDAQWQGLRDLSTGSRVPYLVHGDVAILGQDGADGVTTLRVLEDAEARFDASATLVVGTSDPASGGALDARGTSTLPIRFTSSQPEGIRSPGFWSRVEFLDGSVDGASRMENVTLEFAGAGDLGGVHLEKAAPLLRSNVLQRNGAFSLHAREAHGARLEENVMRRSTTGLFVANTTGATLRGNVVSATLDTAYLSNVSASEFRANRLASDDGVFQLVDGSSGNLILDNNFTRQLGGSPVLDDGSGNVWTNAPALGANVVGGPTLAGNYYSDYAGFDLSDPSDGIGDTGLPYLIPGTAGAGDLYPLVTRERWRSVQGAPETVAFLLGQLTGSGWYNGTVNVQLVATDIENDSFVIRASLDGAAFAEYTAPLIASSAGYHTVDYYAVDSLGNTESLKRVTFRLDPTPPDVSAVLDEGILDDLCGTLDASDGHSGLASLRWSVLDALGAYVVNATNVTLAGIPAAPGERVCADLAYEGRFLLRATAVDEVGIVAEAQTPLATIDIAAPILEILSPKPRHVHAGPIATERPAEPAPPEPLGSAAATHEKRPHLRAAHAKEHVPRAPIAPRAALPDVDLPRLDDAPIIVGTADVEADASDPGSGVALGELLIDGELVANSTSTPFRWTLGVGTLAPGWHNLTVLAHDAAGHVAERTRPFYYVGAQPPTATPPAPPAVAPAPALSLSSRMVFP